MLIPRLALTVFAAGCVAWLASIDTGRRITTDVLDLLPTDERSPELSLVRSVAADVHARAVLFALSNARSDTPPSPEAAAAFLAALRESGAFDEVSLHADPTQRDALGRALHERRYPLLLPDWLQRMQRTFAESGRPEHDFASWTAERAAAELEDFLARPEALAMQDLIAGDPLLLVPRIVRELGDLAVSNSSISAHTLVWARLRASPLSEAGQEPAFAAIDSALAAARALEPTLSLRWTGINRFAAASRARIQSEVALLNLASVAAVFAVAAVFLRRPWQILRLVPLVLFSLLGAWTATTLAFQQVHILVFVIGALLAGIAIDYGFYLALQPPDPRNPSYAARIRPLLRPLLASCFTTVAGFSLLLWSELPLLRQVGLFVASGLLCALGSSLLWFAATPAFSLAPRRLELLERGRFSSRALPLSLAALASILALSAPLLVSWRDDIRELEIPSPELRANDRELRALFGDTPDRAAYLTFGDSLPDAREHLDRFLQHVETHTPDAGVASLGVLFPTEPAWRAASASFQRLDEFPALFRAALERRNFDATAFEGFFASWNEIPAALSGDNYAGLYQDFTPHLPAPLRQTLQPFATRPWFLTILDDPRDLSLPPALNTFALRQLENFNHLFARYRSSALHLSLVGLALVVLGVAALYRDRRAFRIALVPAGACFFTLGLLSLFGHALNLFHLLGAFLGVCLAHDYTIFTAATAQTRAMPPAAVRVSALTTAASFAVLGFSQIPVVHALGTTVAITVSVTLLALEIEARTPRRT